MATIRRDMNLVWVTPHHRYNISTDWGVIQALRPKDQKGRPPVKAWRRDVLLHCTDCSAAGKKSSSLDLNQKATFPISSTGMTKHQIAPALSTVSTLKL